MNVITAPYKFSPNDKNPKIFLAGGITDCPDWQSEVVDLMKEQNVILLNPRRPDFPINDPKAAPQQIAWEFIMLQAADAVLFWFPNDTLNPIVLYELGFRLAANKFGDKKKVIEIGCEDGYERFEDVRIQSKLAGHKGVIHNNLEDLCKSILANLSTVKP